MAGAIRQTSIARTPFSTSRWRITGKRVLTAFADIEDSLAALRTLAGQADATRDAEAFAARAFKIAGTRYETGASNYLDVINHNFVVPAKAGTQVDQVSLGARLHGHDGFQSFP